MSARRERARDEMLHVYTRFSRVVTRSRVRYKLFALERFFLLSFPPSLSLSLSRNKYYKTANLLSVSTQYVCRLSWILINRPSISRYSRINLASLYVSMLSWYLFQRCDILNGKKTENLYVTREWNNWYETRFYSWIVPYYNSRKVPAVLYNAIIVRQEDARFIFYLFVRYIERVSNDSSFFFLFLFSLQTREVFLTLITSDTASKTIVTSNCLAGERVVSPATFIN